MPWATAAALRTIATTAPATRRTISQAPWCLRGAEVMQQHRGSKLLSHKRGGHLAMSRRTEPAQGKNQSHNAIALTPTAQSECGVVLRERESGASGNPCA